MVKITKKLLNDYARIKKEIPLLELELSEMHTSESGIGSSVIINYSDGFPKPEGVVGFNWELYEKRKKILENKRSKVAVVEEWIENIDDVQIRTVFKMRYIQNKSWTKVARTIGYSGKEDYVRIRIRDDYLKKCGII